MADVFIVKHMFDDCKDESYVGVYTNFWGALAAAMADFLKDYGQEEYSLQGLEPDEKDKRLWLEVAYHGFCEGIYYVIDKETLKES